MTQYVIASSKGWFDLHRKSNEFEALDIVSITSKSQLTLSVLDQINPRFVFFTHWNWIVEPEIFHKYECVVFHTAPLPFGRGGSPIQNLIARKIYTAPVCALHMTEVLDGGPIYDSVDISLHGTIEDIFSRIAAVVETLILRIVKFEPSPNPQVGEPVCFKRRNEFDSEVSSQCDLTDFYDAIRMVDGEGYPNAYIKYGRFKLEFSRAVLEDGSLVAKVIVKEDENS